MQPVDTCHGSPGLGLAPAHRLLCLPAPPPAAPQAAGCHLQHNHSRECSSGVVRWLPTVLHCAPQFTLPSALLQVGQARQRVSHVGFMPHTALPSAWPAAAPSENRTSMAHKPGHLPPGPPHLPPCLTPFLSADQGPSAHPAANLHHYAAGAGGGDFPSRPAGITQDAGAMEGQATGVPRGAMLCSWQTRPGPPWVVALTATQKLRHGTICHRASRRCGASLPTRGVCFTTPPRSPRHSRWALPCQLVRARTRAE